MRRMKDNRLVEFPMEDFDISPIMSPVQLDSTKCTIYRLQSVINHDSGGSMDSGHYYAYCLDEDSNKWYEFNDESVTPITNDTIISNNAYLLLYIRKDLINSN